MRDQSLWTWHLLAGAVIVILLGLHMGVMHLNEILGWFNRPETHPVDWENVAARARGIGFTVSYVVLLGAALFHGLYGLRNILLELNPGAALQRAITVVLLAGGLGLFVLGTWAAVASWQLARIS